MLLFWLSCFAVPAAGFGIFAVWSIVRGKENK